MPPVVPQNEDKTEFHVETIETTKTPNQLQNGTQPVQINDTSSSLLPARVQHSYCLLHIVNTWFLSRLPNPTLSQPFQKCCRGPRLGPWPVLLSMYYSVSRPVCLYWTLEIEWALQENDSQCWPKLLFCLQEDLRIGKSIFRISYSITEFFRWKKQKRTIQTIETRAWIRMTCRGPFTDSGLMSFSFQPPENLKICLQQAPKLLLSKGKLLGLGDRKLIFTRNAKCHGCHETFPSHDECIKHITESSQCQVEIKHIGQTFCFVCERSYETVSFFTSLQRSCQN